jgi:hypothetical protein
MALVNVSRQASEVTGKFEKAIEGMTSSWPADQPILVIQEVTYTPVEFLAKLEEVAAPLFDAVAARLALETALATRNAALDEAAALIEAFFTVLHQYLPAGSAGVASFGKKPKKARTPLTLEQKEAAAAKRAATRKARHVMGKKQRRAIQAPAPAAAPGKAGS